jgi:transposase
MKALDDKTIQEIRQRRSNGETSLQLAIEYHVHYRTIENYCKAPEILKLHREWIRHKFSQVI